MQQKLIRRANDPVFKVTYDERAPDLSQVYFTQETLDRFDGNKWSRSGGSNPFDGRGLGQLTNAYQGTTTEWTQKIHSTGLVGPIAPSGGVPIDIQSVDSDTGIKSGEFHYFPDSALYLPTGLGPDDVYQVTALSPQQFQDLGALATGDNGELSPLFANASEAGRFDHIAGPPPNTEVVVPDDLDSYIELPESLPIGLRNTARSVTSDATTDYERAWMLQYWFRDSGDFTYSVDVTSGQTSLDLDEWLNDSTSLNWRTGYCQQFALSMAVLGRELEIPSRVVLGFTPGTPKIAENGTNFIEVRDTNAHAWVEMWMDGFGWVQFDPTPRDNTQPGDTQPTSLTAGFDPARFTPEQSPTELQPPDSTSTGPSGPDFIEEQTASAQTGPRWWLMGLVVVPLVLALIPLTKWLRRRGRLHAIRNGDITAAWDELVDRLTDLGKPVPPSKTPVEFAKETDSALVPIAVDYSSTIYGGREGQGEESHLYSVGGWVHNNFDSIERLKAAVNPKSLLKRD